MGVGVVKFSFPHFFHDPGRCIRKVLPASIYMYCEKHSRCIRIAATQKKLHLTFVGPCIVSIFQYISNKCNVTQFILSGNCPTCFGWYFHPSSGLHTTVSTASGVCHTVTATYRYSGR